MSGVRWRVPTTREGATTERNVIHGETITEDGVERRQTLRKDYGAGGRHRDGEAGGAVGGGVAGAIFGGPVRAVVGGAIAAATGATAGATDQKDKNEKVVVRRAVQRP